MPFTDSPHGHGYDDDPTPRRPHRAPPGTPSLRPVLFVAVTVLIVGLTVAGVWLGARFLGHLRPQPAATNPDEQPKVAVANGPLDAEEVEANTLFETDKDSVVNVDTIQLRRGQFGLRGSEQQTGTGSGFVWDQDARVVTNYHVVHEAVGREGTIEIRVVMADRHTYKARIVGTAPDFDLAVIQMLNPPAKDRLKPISVATSADLKVGQKVFAIGNPFALSLTLTTGIISNLDRTIEAPTGSPIVGAIQHTAQINPGNSGGPLLNKFGKLVGVNTSITTPSGGNVGIGFSIPSDTVNDVVTKIIRNERPLKPDLGVSLFDQSTIRRAGYDTGVMIATVVPGGPAGQAKLRGVRRDPQTGRIEPGDVILAINDETVGSVDDFQQIVAKLHTGQQVKVRYLRDEAEHEATLTVRGV
jgi:S1-C subfamily serine protease